MTENKRFTRHKSLDRDCTIYDELKDFQFPSLPLGVSEIFCDKLNELHEENKELIQFKEQVFNLIDKKLEENKELDGVDTAMYYANKQTLNELKKELQ